MEFGKGTGFMFNKYVNLVLNTMTGNEHEKYLKYLKDKQEAATATAVTNAASTSTLTTATTASATASTTATATLTTTSTTTKAETDEPSTTIKDDPITNETANTIKDEPMPQESLEAQPVESNESTESTQPMEPIETKEQTGLAETSESIEQNVSSDVTLNVDPPPNTQVQAELETRNSTLSPKPLVDVPSSDYASTTFPAQTPTETTSTQDLISAAELTDMTEMDNDLPMTDLINETIPNLSTTDETNAQEEEIMTTNETNIGVVAKDKEVTFEEPTTNSLSN